MSDFVNIATAIMLNGTGTGETRYHSDWVSKLMAIENYFQFESDTVPYALRVVSTANLNREGYVSTSRASYLTPSGQSNEVIINYTGSHTVQVCYIILKKVNGVYIPLWAYDNDVAMSKLLECDYGNYFNENVAYTGFSTTNGTAFGLYSREWNTAITNVEFAGDFFLVGGQLYTPYMRFTTEREIEYYSSSEFDNESGSASVVYDTYHVTNKGTTSDVSEYNNYDYKTQYYAGDIVQQNGFLWKCTADVLPYTTENYNWSDNWSDYWEAIETTCYPYYLTDVCMYNGSKMEYVNKSRAWIKAEELELYNTMKEAGLYSTTNTRTLPDGSTTTAPDSDYTDKENSFTLMGATMDTSTTPSSQIIDHWEKHYEFISTKTVVYTPDMAGTITTWW